MRPGGLEHVSGEADGSAGGGAEKLLAAGGVEPATTIKSVDKYGRIVRVADQKVPGHADRLQMDTAAASDLDQEHRQRDRYAQAAVEYLVQIRVARVVVGAPIPLQSDLVE